MSDFSQRLSDLSRERLILLAEGLRDQLHERGSRVFEPIALIGMSCRFPSAPTVEDYWKLLHNGGDAIRDVPPERRWDRARYYDPDPDAPGRMYTWQGGFLDQVDLFDPAFFGISPREAMRMDPQQRLLLESVWEALEDAGQAPERLEGTPTGMFVGLSTNDFLQIGCKLAGPADIDPYSGTGSAGSIAAGRISYCLGLQGPNFPVDTACSSSLVALHLACQSLQNGESSLAVTAAVNLMLSPETSVYFCKVRALSPDGRCKTFDASANGYVRCEGCAAVVLKRLSDAQADGDRILAVIRGSAVNHDGRTTGLTVPNGESQERLLRQALARSGVRPGEISYVEAHGTGTPLGDPIEVRALGNVFGEDRDTQRPLLVGSVKTNIGHAEAAAGLAGLIKVVLALQHRQIPAHLHFRQPNPYIPWARLPIRVVQELQPWEPLQGRRLAGVSSFGFSGTNAHVILEEAPETITHAPAARTPTRITVSPSPNELESAFPERPRHILALSSRTVAALHQVAQRMLDRLLVDDDTSLADICYTTGYGRSHFGHRWSAVVSDRLQACEALRGFLTSDQKHAGRDSVATSNAKRQATKLVFVFTGEGALPWGAGRELFESQADFRQAFLECERIFRETGERSLVDLMYGEPPDGVRDGVYVQPAIFALEYALACMWKAWGVTPAVVLGHSVGEFAAAVVAGILSLQDALQFVAARARSIWQGSDPGRMLAVAANVDLVQELLEPLYPRLTIAAVNAPRNTVVSGEPAAMQEFEELVAQKGISCLRLDIERAFHSPLLDPVMAGLSQLANSFCYQPPRLGYVSSVTGKLATSEVAQGSYWGEQVRQPVQFQKAVQTLRARGYELFLELGPAPVLTACGRLATPGEPCQWLSSLRPESSSWLQALTTLSELYQAGVSVDWQGFDRPYARRFVSLPTYPFQRQSFTPEFQSLNHRTDAGVNTAIPRMDQPELESGLNSNQSLATTPPALGVDDEAPTPRTVADMVYSLEWREHRTASTDVGDTSPGGWLILTDDMHAGLGRGIADALLQRGDFCQFVLPGQGAGKRQGDVWYLDPSRPEAFSETLREIAADGRTWLGIIYLWTQRLSPPEGDTHIGNGKAADEDACSHEGHPWFESQALAVGGILHLVQALAHVTLPGSPRLVLITRGAQSVIPEDTLEGWWQSPVWGLARVIAAEHPLLRCVRIDLDPRAHTGVTTGGQKQDLLTSRLLSLLVANEHEDQYAIRDDRVYVPRLVSQADLISGPGSLDEANGSAAALANNSSTGLLRPDATYLISGGLGGLGLLLARWLVQQGARHVCLVGRTSPSQQAESVVHELRSQGATIEVRLGDVTDWSFIQRLVTELYQRPNPLRGIVHAAGTLDDDLLVELTWQRFWSVMRPKLEGTWNLHCASQEGDLDFFVCFSSIASLLGSPRQANYAAANAFLDGFAHYRRRRSLPALSINWGPWSEAGMAARMGEQHRRTWASLGIETIETTDGWKLLQELLRSKPTQVGVFAADWSRVFAHVPPGLEPPVLRELASGHRKIRESSPAWKQLCKDLRAMPAGEHADLVFRYVEDLIAAALGWNAETPLDPQMGFFDLGMDSLIAVELRTRLQADIGPAQVLPVTFILDHPTVDSVAQFLLRHVVPRILGDPCTGDPCTGDPCTGDPCTGQVELPQVALSPAEVSPVTEQPEPSDPVPQEEHAHCDAPTVTSAGRSSYEPIAVIGLGCRFPGGVHDSSSFWRLLSEGVDAIREVPADRWDVDAWFDPDPDAPGKMNTRYGGFLDEVQTFDANFFGIAPREAIRMDPQQRILLEVAVHALEHAHQPLDRLAGSPTGVFIGLSGNDYLSVLRRANDPAMVDGWLAMGNALSIAAGRLSHVFNWRGPCMVVDTACSSSLVAIHLACESLRDGKTNLALAGGVGLILGPEITVSLTKARAMAPDGRCKTFDASANGYVRSEGCGLVVLKRLSDAQRAGDPILAVIRGSAINHDGRSSGLTVPNIAAQQELLDVALRSAELEPCAVQYLEAHGTGTPLGDPIELQAINAVYGVGRSHTDRLFVGSVKTNLGHLEAAAGVAGLIKVVLALQHATIPPHLHFRRPNPFIPWQDLAVEIPTESIPWRCNGQPRRAGVSSFGFSGTNAHVILEEPAPVAHKGRPIPKPARRPAAEEQLLCLSAKSDTALQELATRLAALLESPQIDLRDVCYSVAAGRAAYPHRLIVCTDSSSEVREALRAFAAGQSHRALRAAKVESSRAPKVAFLFTGQGSQYVQMGRELFQTQPVFREILEDSDRLLRHEFDLPLLNLLYPAEGSEGGTDPREGRGGKHEQAEVYQVQHQQNRSHQHCADVSVQRSDHHLDQTACTQPALFALEVALARLWQSWGIQPSAVLGHSVGEYAAACIAGVFSWEEGLRLIARRGQLMQAIQPGGGMAAIRAPLQTVESALRELNSPLAIAAVNGPLITVVSGEDQALSVLLDYLRDRNIASQRLTVSHAFHSPVMEPMLQAFHRWAYQVKYAEPELGLVSNLTGKFAGPTEVTSADYWCRHVREPVRFVDGIQTLAEAKYQVFLEIGPEPVLLGMARQCLPEQRQVWLPSLRKVVPNSLQLQRTLGELFLQGVPIDWREYYRHQDCRWVELPGYPFQRQRFWPDLASREEPLAAVDERTTERAPELAESGGALLGRKFESCAFPGSIFENRFDAVHPALLAEHRVHSMVVVPGAAHLSMVLAAAQQKCEGPVALTEVSFPEALILPENEPRTIQVILTPEASGLIDFRVVSHADGEPSHKWLRHATGKCLLSPHSSSESHLRRLSETSTRSPSEPEPPHPPSLADVQTRCGQYTADAQTLYEMLARTGVELGPSFRWNAEIWRRDGESLTRLQRPNHSTVLDNAAVHPGLIDSCIQAAAFALPSGKQDFSAYIPVSIARCTVYRPPADALWCHSRIVEETRQSSGTYLFDVLLFDAAGQVVLQMENMRLQRAPRTAIMAFAQRRLREWLYRLHWVPQPLEVPHLPSADGSWLIFADRQGLGARLARMLERHGGSCTLVRPGREFIVKGRRAYQIAPTSPEQFQRLYQEATQAAGGTWRGIIFLWPTEAVSPDLAKVRPRHFDAAQRMGCHSLLHLLHAISRSHLRQPPKLWMVTRGTQWTGEESSAIDIGQAPLWGLARVAALEFPHMAFARIDLSSGRNIEQESNALEMELLAPDGEDQIAYRGGARLAARLVQGSSGRLRQYTGAGPGSDEPYRLIKGETASIEGLQFQPVGRIPAAHGEVEICVRATGLNFRDVLNTLGLYPGDAGPLGLECSGTITATGPGVEGLHVGDRVLAIAPGCLGPFVLTDARLVARIPDEMSFAEAATIPIVFLTAEHVLRNLAKLTAKDSVLIHSAAGGVGLAALQVARRVGARVIATAGSEEKREFVRQLGVDHVFDSRNLDFADRVREATQGRGVDVVLNALPGEFVARNLAALSSGGRFVEIGKSQTWENERWGERRPDVKYLPFALDDWAIHQPSAVGELLQQLMSDFSQGHYRPLPQCLFPMAQVKDAFRFMAQSRHIGKVVIEQDDFRDRQAELQKVRSDATYLITGGLGGLGLLVARWLVERGARYLVLLGRRPPSTETRKVLEELEHSGTTIVVRQVDVAQRRHLVQVLDVIRSSLPPLKGIVHAAGVLDDGVLLQQDWSRFDRAMAPKVKGALHLHELTLGMDLDWLVLFSSVASLWGSPGQGNYAAANAALDALAHARRQAGLPAMAINWGPWSEVGMAARMQQGAGRHWWEVVGIGMITPPHGITILEMLINEDATQVAVMPMDWSRLLAQIPQGMAPPMVKQLLASQQKALEPSREWLEFVQVLTEAPPAERVDLLVQHIQDEAARVLGLDSNSRLDPHVPLNELGFDSLMAVELANQLTAATGISLPVTLLFDYPTLHAISGYMVRDILKLEIGIRVMMAPPGLGESRPPISPRACCVPSVSSRTPKSPPVWGHETLTAPSRPASHRGGFHCNKPECPFSKNSLSQA